ncbi:MAG: helix-turn-helix transcriptional regulator [Candidatus Microthrix sp.]|nr:helix-turn-helix transcriptional regulator [Candidatus Microthrix sp.]
MDVAAQLRSCRARAGLSQTALANAAGTSQPTVATYESGRVTPNVSTPHSIVGSVRLHAGRRARGRRAQMDQSRGKEPGDPPTNRRTTTRRPRPHDQEGSA